MSVPFTRTLPYVLREQLEEGKGIGVLVARVVAIPDRAHVLVDISGQQVTLAKLSSYTDPKVGESAYVLSDPLFTIALGAVTASAPPGSQDATTLDGIDSTGFWRLAADGAPNTVLKRAVAGAEQTWWAKTPAFTAAVNSVQAVNHPLGRVPAVALFTPNYDADVNVDSLTASQVGLRWRQATTNATGNLLVIG